MCLNTAESPCHFTGSIEHPNDNLPDCLSQIYFHLYQSCAIVNRCLRFTSVALLSTTSSLELEQSAFPNTYHLILTRASNNHVHFHFYSANQHPNIAYHQGEDQEYFVVNGYHAENIGDHMIGDVIELDFYNEINDDSTYIRRQLQVMYSQTPYSVVTIVRNPVNIDPTYMTTFPENQVQFNLSLAALEFHRLLTAFVQETGYCKIAFALQDCEMSDLHRENLFFLNPNDYTTFHQLNSRGDVKQIEVKAMKMTTSVDKHPTTYWFNETDTIMVFPNFAGVKSIPNDSDCYCVSGNEDNCACNFQKKFVVYELLYIVVTMDLKYQDYVDGLPKLVTTSFHEYGTDDTKISKGFTEEGNLFSETYTESKVRVVVNDNRRLRMVTTTITTTEQIDTITLQ